jgi:prepilin-type N-terminal cleavage/methylation domain-containing protein/prepilin-type processing-associated H-X9-DG protein
MEADLMERLPVRRRTRPGFTIVEVLVAISVVSLLAALLMPALQSAREASRRALCLNNLRQLGVAVHSYHSTHGLIVPGRIFRVEAGPPPASGCDGSLLSGCQDTPWFVLLLPELEQQPLYNQFNFDLGAEGPGYAKFLGFFANTTVFGTKIGVFQCPSDRNDPFRFDTTFQQGQFSGPVLTRGNYAMNWGNTRWDQAGLTGPPVAYLPSAFGHTSRSFAAVTDGLSQSVFAGEILQGATHDIRGLVWTSVPGAGTFMSRFAPNQTQDIYKRTSGFDLLPDDSLCTSEPQLGLPCLGVASQYAAFAGARSRHPGLINALFGDGSVRPVKSTVDPAIWVALGSISSGEVVQADSY